MLTVKKFNPISDIVYTQMPQDRYRFIEDGENYDVALAVSYTHLTLPTSFTV